MKASIYKNYGPPDVLEYVDIEAPVPKSNELLIKVHAATVNRTDCAMLRAKPYIMRLFTGLLKPKRQILGTDFAGCIEAVGSNVTNFKAGDKIFGFNDLGVSSHAQYLTISAHEALALIPENTSYEKAAASLEGVHYAYNFINKITLKSGDTVLVNGATGAIGSAMVQLLTYFGAQVTAVCDGKHAELIKTFGATKTIDYTKEDFTQTNEKYKFVFDAVGKSSFAKCKPILTTKGIYISSELGYGAQNIFYAVFTPIICMIPGFRSNKRVVFPIPSNHLASVLLIKRLIEEGKFDALIDKFYSLEETSQAFLYVESGRKIGNVILKIA
jgi:NADPH:quinone reductase-like Zn-dependent oxidoreductase